MNTLDVKFYTAEDILNRKVGDLSKTLEDKQDKLNGYQDVWVTLDGDGDTFNIETDDGQSFKGRLGGNSEGNYVDTPEKSMSNSYGQGIGSDPYKSSQLAFMSRMTGKHSSDLTDEDFGNYNNFVVNQVGNILSNKPTSDEYNPQEIYNNNYNTTRIRTKAKLGNQVSSSDSRLVVDFKVGDSTLANLMYEDSRLNTNKLTKVEFSESYFREQEQGVVDNLVNTAQAAGYKFGAKVIDWSLSEEGMKNSKLFGVNLYDIAYTEGTSEQLAGVSRKNYLDFQGDMEQASKDFQDGNYLDWLGNVITNAPTILAQSAPEMAVTAVATIATGGGSLATQALGVGSAMLINAGTYTSEAMDTYKKNNNGKEMPIEDMLFNLAANMFAEGIDIVTFKSVSKFIPGMDKMVNKVESAVTKQGIKGFISNFGNATLTGASGEFIQEGIQTANQSYFTQDQTKKQSYTDILYSKETLEAAATGAVVGGTMSASGVTASIPVQVLRSNSKAMSESIESAVKPARVSDIDEASVKSFKEVYSNIDINKIDYNNESNVAEVLSSLSSYTGAELDSKSLEDRTNMVFDIVTLARINGTNVPKQYAKLANQVDQEIILNSSPDFNKMSTSEQDTKAEQLAEDFGMSKSEILLLFNRNKSTDKSSGQVTQDVRFGKAGYNTYGAIIDDLQESLISSTMSVEQRDKIESIVSKTAGNVTRLYNNQLDKAKSFLNGVLEQVNTKADTTISYGNSEFTMVYDYMVGNYQDRGAFAIIPTLIQDIKEMEYILESTDNRVEDSFNVSEYVNTFEQAIRDMGSENYEASLIRDMLYDYIESTSSDVDTSTNDVDTTVIEQNEPSKESKVVTEQKVKDEPKVSENASEVVLKPVENKPKKETKPTKKETKSKSKEPSKGEPTHIKKARRDLVKAEKELKTTFNKKTHYNDIARSIIEAGGLVIDDAISKTVAKELIEKYGRSIVKATGTPLDTMVKNISDNQFEDGNDLLDYLLTANKYSEDVQVRLAVAEETVQVASKVIKEYEKYKVSLLKNGDNLKSAIAESNLDKAVNQLRKSFNNPKGSLEDKVFNNIVNKLPKDLSIVFVNSANVGTFGLKRNLDSFNGLTIGNTIYLNEDKWNDVNSSIVLYHEMDHVVTSSRIRESANKNDINFRELSNIWKYLKDNGKQLFSNLNDSDKQLVYYFLGYDKRFSTEMMVDEQPTYRAIEEMVAIAKTSPAIREVLQLTEYKTTDNIFTQILNIVSKLIGLPRSSVNVYQSIITLSDIGIEDTGSVYISEDIQYEDDYNIPYDNDEEYINIPYDDETYLNDFSYDNIQTQRIELSKNIPKFGTPTLKTLQVIKTKDTDTVTPKLLEKVISRVTDIGSLSNEDIQILNGNTAFISSIVSSLYRKKGSNERYINKLKGNIDNLDAIMATKITKKQNIDNIKTTIKSLEEQIKTVENNSKIIDEVIKSDYSNIDAFVDEKFALKEVYETISKLREELTTVRNKVKDIENYNKIPAVNTSTVIQGLKEFNELFNTPKVINYAKTLAPSDKSFSYLATHKSTDSSLISQFIQYTGYNATQNFFNKEKTLAFTPAIALIINLENGKPKFNNNAVTAIDLACKSLAVEGSYVLNPTEDSLDSIPLSNGTLEAPDSVKSSFVSSYGNFRSTVAHELGSQIMDLLGYRESKDKDGDIRAYNTIVSNLGNIALNYMEGLGYIKSYSPEQIKEDPKFSDLNILGHTVKYTLNFNDKKKVAEELVKLEEMYLFDVNPNKRVPLKVKPNKITKATLQKDNTTELPKEQIEVINILQQRGYKVDHNTIGKVFYNSDGTRNQKVIDNVLKIMGFEFDLDNISMDDYQSATGLDKRVSLEKSLESTTGKNGTLKQELESLLELHEEGYEGDYYLKWFIGSNGRFNAEGDINPQTKKNLQRALMRSSGPATFDLSQETDKLNFYYGLAVAFDFVGTAEKIEDTATKLMSVKADTLRKALLEDNKDSLEEVLEVTGLKEFGVETIGHAILAIEAIEAFQNSGNKPFTTSFVTEHDATTSGYYIRFMQYANRRIKEGDDKGLPDSNMLSKVGVITKDYKGEGITLDSTIDDLKALDTFLDIYKTTINNYKLELITPDDPIEYQAITDLVENTIGKKDGALLRVEDGKITGALRKLAKPATMVFGYGAGRMSIARETGKALLQEHLRTFYKNQLSGVKFTNPAEESFYNFIRGIIELNIGDGSVDKEFNKIIELMKSKSINEIPVNGFDISLGDLLQMTYANTVGQSVYRSLEIMYSEDTKISESYNNVYKGLGELYISLEQELRDKLSKENNGIIPRGAYQEGIKQLRIALPSISTALNTEGNIHANLPIIGTETDVPTLDGERVTYTALNPYAPKNDKGAMSSVTTTPKNRKLIAESTKAAVVSIHSIDASIIAKTVKKLNEMGIDALPIHDAIQVSAEHSITAVQVFNEMSQLVNEEYSMFEQLATSLNKLMDYSKGDGVWAEEIKKGLSNTVVSERVTSSGKLVIIKLSQVLNDFRTTIGKVRENRNILISTTKGTANIGGPKGSTYVDPSYQYEQEAKDILGSSPKDKTESDKKELRKVILSSNEARLDLFDSLLDEQDFESKEHKSRLRDMLGKFNDNLFQELEAILYETKDKIGRAEYNLTNNTVTIDKPRTAEVARSIQSTASNYVHEVVHAVTASVVFNPNLYEATDLVRQANRLYMEAHQNLDYTSLLQDKDNATPADIKRAKQLWSYIFNSKDSKKGLSEFIAYALTNEPFINNLKQIKSHGRGKEKLPFVDRIIQLGNDILDIFRGNKPFSAVFPAFTGVITGTSSVKDINKDMYSSVLAITDRLANVHNKYINNLNKTKKGLITEIYSYIRDGIEKGNLKISTLITKLVSFRDIGFDTPVGKRRGDTLAHNLLYLSEIIVVALGRVLTSAKARKQLSGFLSSTGLFRGWGFVQTFLRDISRNDDSGKIFDSLSAQVDNIEGASQRIMNATYVALKEGFSRDLTKEEDTALTNVVLSTDLSSLSYSFDVKDIKNMLNDESLLKKEIKTLELNSRNKVSDENKKALTNYTTLMAHYMVTKEGFEASIPNTFLLARKLGNPSIEPELDMIVTLKALSMISKEDKALVANLDDKGIKLFLETHSNFKKDNMETGGATKDSNLKGWYKTVNNDNRLTHYGLSKEEPELLKKGYVKILDLGNGMGYYKHKYTNKQTRDGASFTSKGAFAYGTAIQEFSNSSISEKLTREKMEDIELANINEKAGLTANKIEKMIYNNPNLTYDDIRNITMGMNPIISKVYGKDGGKSYITKWYSYSLNNNQKAEALDLETSGLNILSKMMGSHALWAQSEQVNDSMLSFLVNDMKSNFGRDNVDIKKINSIIGNNGKNYLAIHPEHSNKYIKEHYGALPLVVRKYIEDGTTLFIREDFINQIFGVPSYSLSQAKAFNKAPTVMKQSITFLELVMKEIAKFVKNSIVVGLPVVVYQNIIGNISTMLYYGISPVKAIRTTLKAFRNTREYVKDRRELDILTAKNKIGDTTSKENEKIKLLKNKLENNPVHELFEEGLYQSIVEDLKDTEYKLASKGVQFVESKVKSSVFKPAQEVFRQAFMLEGTPIYDVLYEVVQYSDFAARAAQYEIMMEKAPKDLVDLSTYKKNIIADIRDLYINYNKPNSKYEQYMDDLGLFMFIKYAKRVNSVILGIFQDRPVSAILATLFQLYIVDTPDMIESNGLTRDWTNNLHSPIDNIITAVKPRLFEAVSQTL